MAKQLQTVPAWKPSNPLPNPNWEKFCQLYVTDKEFFGNGAESYLEAYPRQEGQRQISYLTAKASASRLLTNANLLARINHLLELQINNEIVDKNLGLVILQNADFKAKVAAIKEYNQLKKRVELPGGRPIIVPMQITIIREKIAKIYGKKG